MRYLLLLTVLLFSELLSSQGYYIRGQITDYETGQPIENVHVTISGVSIATTISDFKGNFAISLSEINLTIVIKFNAINYKPIEIEKKISGKETLLAIKMEFAPVMLPEVGIFAGPDTVWSNDVLNVADFILRPAGMLLLTYEKEERWKRQEDSKTTLYAGCRLILLDSLGNEVTRYLVSELCRGFQTNFYGDVFLMSHKKIHLVDIAESKISISEIERKVFEQQIEPVIDSIQQRIYFSNYTRNFPAFEYMIYNAKDSTQQSMRYVVDEQMMKMFRSEYKYMQPREKLEAFRFELDTGIDREIIAAYMRGFQNTYYYEPLNSPLLVANDTLLLFDHTHDKLIRFDQQGNPIDSTSITYHKNNKLHRWSEKLVKDLADEKIYTYFDRQGYHYVKAIDQSTGATGSAMKLTHRYSENIRIRKGYVYYVYRPYESAQKRFLYRERLQF